MKQKHKEDFRRKCRLCGRLGRRFPDIFNSAQSKPNKLSRLIFNCLRLKVREDDHLPIKICDDCNKKLTSWYTFYKKCQETQKKLQKDFENYFNLCCLEYSIELSPESSIKSEYFIIYNTLPNLLTPRRAGEKIANFPTRICKENDSLSRVISVSDEQKVTEFSENTLVEIILPHSLTTTNKQNVKEFPEKTFTEDSLPELFSSINERKVTGLPLPTLTESALSDSHTATNQQKETEYPQRTLIVNSLPDLFTPKIEPNVIEFTKTTLTEDLLATSSDQEENTEFTVKTFAEDSLSHSFILLTNEQKATDIPERSTENYSPTHLLTTDTKVTEYPERTLTKASLLHLLTSATEQREVSTFSEQSCKRKYSSTTDKVTHFLGEMCKKEDTVSHLLSSVIEKHSIIELPGGVHKENAPLSHVRKSETKQQHFEELPKNILKNKALQNLTTPTSKVIQVKHKNDQDKVPIPEVNGINKKAKLSDQIILVEENEHFRKESISESCSNTSLNLIREHSDHIKQKEAVQNRSNNDTICTDIIQVPIIPQEGILKQCEVCEKTFTCKVKLRRHIARHRYVAEHQCETCNKLFKTKFTLRCHMLTHSDKRNYCCHICGQLFRTAPCLCNHIKLHSDVKQFVCTLCGKAFRQSNHLDLHNRTHTGERPYHCSECSQGFTTRCKLIRHIQAVHNGVKKYKCMICAKEFLYNNNYKAHLLRHEGQKNIKCEVCGKSFVTNNALLRHRRFHTGEKPFKCDICGQTFADCSNRKRHMIKHQDPKPVPKPRNRRKSMKLPKLDTLVMQDPDTEEVKTYANLRTFLESSEVAETLTSGQCDDNDPLMNVEYVTLMAANEEDMVTLDSGIQEVITLPEDNRISEYELLLKSPLSPETFDGQQIQDNNVFQTASSKNTAISSYQPVDVDSNDLIEVFLTPKTGMIEDKLLEENISLMDKKDEAFSKDLESNNLLEVFLESQNNHEPSQGIDISMIEKDETYSSEIDETANIIKVLMAHETHTANKDMKTDSNFFSLDNLSDQESIIRMLNNQGTTVA